jgi:hypothetical protein
MIMKDMFVRICKELVIPVSVYQPGMHLEILRKVTKYLRKTCRPAEISVS